MTARLTMVLLPGMDGTGRLFEPFISALQSNIVPLIVSYPAEQQLLYEDLEQLVLAALPVEGQFGIVAESFSGPIALRIAARRPKGLVGIALVASFVRRPIRWLPKCLVSMVGSCAAQFPGVPSVMRQLLLGSFATRTPAIKLQETLRTVRPSVYRCRLRAVMGVDVAMEFLNCPVPLFYLAGALDRIVGLRALREMQAIRPDLEYAVIDGPHLLLQCCPPVAAGHI